LAKLDPSVQSLLEKILKGQNLINYRKGAKLFSQGEKSDAIYFVQTGRVQLTVISTQGKNAVLAALGPRSFAGEECLVRNCRRASTATSLVRSTVFRVEKAAMLKALHGQPHLSDKLIASLLARNIDLQEDLCSQLFNHTELRLARVLLKLSRAGRPIRDQGVKVSGITHKHLAELLGISQPKISLFMKTLKKLGLIDYDKGNADITVMAEALTDRILRNEFKTAEPSAIQKNKGD
jgi:CRP/FNR family cyclic AMP-dependent transcriptional regulator